MATARPTRPRLDKDLLLYSTVQEVHKETYRRINDAFEEVHTWLFEVLEEAKKEFGRSENGLLPKTPSAKRRRGRQRKTTRAAKRRLSLESDDGVPPAKQQECSRVEEDSVDATPVAEKPPSVLTTPDAAIHHQSEATPPTVKQTDTRTNRQSKAAKRKLSVEPDSEDVPPAKQECSGLQEEPPEETEARSTRSRNFQTTTAVRSTRTRARQHAVETSNTEQDSTLRPSKECAADANKENESSEETKLDERWENFETQEAVRSTRTKTHQPHVDSSRELESSVRSPVKVKEKAVSLDASSDDRPEEPQAVAAVRSTRTKTRQRMESSNTELESSVRQCIVSEKEKDLQSDARSDEGHEEPQAVAEVRSTRTKTRQRMESSNIRLESSVRPCFVAEKGDLPLDSRSDERSENFETTTAVRSTRTKTRQQQAEIANRELESTVQRSSQEKEKALSPDAASDNRSENYEAATAVRSTRTKTRQQAAENARKELKSPEPSKTMDAELDENKTPTNASSADSNSDDDVPLTCPPNKIVRPHPKSFLNDLHKFAISKAPPNLNTSVVRSFIARNSPLHKPTLKEIQEKRKKELMEKSRANEERLRRQEEEQKKKIEENRKKREERMKRAQEIREQRKQRDVENRQLLEKKMVHQKQLTEKLREERQREERERQRIRNLKLEEAEERRKQEEEQRQKKLQEQLESERIHAEMMQKKREQEELERQRQKEEKQRAEERIAELEREREKELEKRRQAEEEKAKLWKKKKEEREKLLAQERAEKERQELERKWEREQQFKKEQERLREQDLIREECFAIDYVLKQVNLTTYQQTG